ncbi:rad, Gem/Kir family member 2 isoform X1 [Musca autumnalis]|uniref:rad, Gem/Kir family member 2 isoform X1 n=1 Tax=Musca autumnalis TaxID=221902 RepID=UPI003CF4CABC
MTSPRHPPHSPRFTAKFEQHHYSWDETAAGFSPKTTMAKVATRTSSSPLPFINPKHPRTLPMPIGGNAYDSVIKPSTLPSQRSPSIRSNYSCQSNFSDAPTTSSAPNTRSSSRDNPPRSPKITTTFANDSSDDALSSASYYHTPSSGSRSPKAVYSNDNSMDSPSGNMYSGNQTPLSPRRSPHTPCKFVFEAISPVIDSPSRKFEYYEPVSPDIDQEDFGENPVLSGRYFEGNHSAAPMSPNFYEPHRKNSKKLLRSGPLENLPRINTKKSPVRNDEWDMTVSSNMGGYQGLGPNNYYLKRDSCVTDCTQLSVESETSTVATTTTSFSYSDTSTRQTTTTDQTQDLSPLAEQKSIIRKRRHAINITSNPGYQVLHSSHSTLDRTCSDSIVSLRHRKSTSDLTQDTDGERGKSKLVGESSTPTATSYKPRRRGSSKGGLAYLASRRSSRESMKSACSNASLVSNDDIGPLAFQASNRGRQRRTSNFLELPVPDHFRPRVCSLPDRPYNPRVSDDLYRLRHFSISKGNVVNCGDSIISRRSRSNTSVNSTNSRASERSPFDGSCCGGGYANVDSVPASPDEDSENVEPPPPPRYRVVMLGDAGVGKTALVNQFMTSEYMHTYDASLVLDDEFGEKTVSVLLDDEESELVFIDHPSVEMSVENSLSTYEPHGCVVVFSIVEKSSFRVAEEIMNYLWQENYTKDKAVILVGNKADLARSRVISSQDGKTLAASRDAKFIETSSGIQHNVDELLVGVLKQMRLKESREKKANSSKMKTSRTHISLQMAKEILQKICLTDISKSKSCENLHVL